MKIRTLAIGLFGLTSIALISGCSLQEAASMLLISDNSAVSNFSVSSVESTAPIEPQSAIKYLQVVQESQDVPAEMQQSTPPPQVLQALQQMQSGMGQPGMGQPGMRPMPRRQMRPVANAGDGRMCPRCPKMEQFANAVAFSLIQEANPDYAQEVGSKATYVEVTNLSFSDLGEGTAYQPNEGKGEPVFLKTEKPGAAVAIFDEPGGNPLTIEDAVKGGSLPVKAFDRQRVTILESQSDGWHLVDAGSYQGWVQGV